MNYNEKPIIKWYKNGDPTKDYSWVTLLGDVNIIRTKSITEEFINVCLQNKSRIYLHVVITGMNATQLEHNIKPVKEVFYGVKSLIDKGFPKNKILIVVDPIIPNKNGIGAISLILRLFTEFRELRFTKIKFEVLKMFDVSKNIKKIILHDNTQKIVKQISDYRPVNKNINKRLNNPINNMLKVITKFDSNFYKEYYNLINQYRNIIHIDTGDEATIGIRELKEFGLLTSFAGKPLISYIKQNKKYPDLPLLNTKDIIQTKNGILQKQCKNGCIFCPFV